MMLLSKNSSPNSLMLLTIEEIWSA